MVKNPSDNFPDGGGPRGGERGTPEHPVVLLEVQMHSKVAFHHRLAAQSFRSLQQHPEVLHMAVVVVLPHRRLRLGPAQLPHQLQEFLAGVYWLSLEELGHQSGLHPLISHLTLPVLSKAELRPVDSEGRSPGSRSRGSRCGTPPAQPALRPPERGCHRTHPGAAAGAAGDPD